MPLTFSFVCPLRQGIHARPASLLEGVAQRFKSTVTLLNERTGVSADAKTILSIIGSTVQHHDVCRLTVSGSDEAEAMTELTRFLREEFPHSDDALGEAAPAAAEFELPPALPSDSAKFLPAKPVVGGIGRGKVVRVGQFQIPLALRRAEIASAKAEWEKIGGALDRLYQKLVQSKANLSKGIDGQLIVVQRALVRDMAFRQKLQETVEKLRCSAAEAIAQTELFLTSQLKASENPRLRERAVDIQDVTRQLLQEIYGTEAIKLKVDLAEDSIVIAEELTPAQFLSIERKWLKGLVLAQAGTTSHTVILARSFAIPTLVGADLRMIDPGMDGQTALVDGEIGALLTHLTGAAERYYQLEAARLSGRAGMRKEISLRPAISIDGHRIEVLLNVGATDDLPAGLAEGAEGVGLVRTEMLFLNHETFPTEEAQWTVYRQMLETAGARPVVIRTFDFGGDKPVGYVTFGTEENPFLGCRGVRLYRQLENGFRSQIRALLRAATTGNLRIMIPMITNLQEARWVKQIVASEKEKLAAEGIPFAPNVPIGAMVEVPAAVFAIRELAQEFDFFSVGSNDLLQYFFAADRTNGQVASLNDPLQPAFLRCLQQLAQSVHAAGKTLSLCGEMGGDARLLPLLLGLDFDSVSAGGASISRLKEVVADSSWVDCRELVRSALAATTPAEVADLLARKSSARQRALVTPELVMLEVDAQNKAEVIKLAVDRLFVAGRTNAARALEQAVWAREKVHPTAFGHEFAIPHGKTDAVETDSVMLIKLRTPVAWGGEEGESVRTVILLAMRESGGPNNHLRVLATLARKLMHEEFRQELNRNRSGGELCAFLSETIHPQNLQSKGIGP
jgi:fructose-specific PTS system IIA-like component